MISIIDIVFEIGTEIKAGYIPKTIPIKKLEINPVQK